MSEQTRKSGQGLENRIAAWREYLGRRQTIRAEDRDELEDHLRHQIADLQQAGLANDEAFLVAVKRMGEIDALTQEFALEHSDRLWKQLVTVVDPEQAGRAAPGTETKVVLGLAVAAGAAVKLPSLLGLEPTEGADSFYARNASLFVMPFLAIYFSWKRRVSKTCWLLGAAVFGIAFAVVNLLPFQSGGSTEMLVAMHLPIALWLVIGVAYTGGSWQDREQRMNFVRFSGELFIYYVLIALGGGVLTGTTIFMFNAVGLDAEGIASRWILPCGAAGAALVAAWLVEAKQGVIENMAPVLTRLFTPLFALVLLVFLVTMLWTGRAVEVQREVLIGFDLLLVVVLGLLLYAVSARDPRSGPSSSDFLQLTLLVCALLVDAVALAAVLARISELGLSPNKVAALGENLVLLVNLSWSAWLYTRFLRGRGPFDSLARWQTAYLPVYSSWAGVVIVIFPPLFGFR